MKKKLKNTCLLVTKRFQYRLGDTNIKSDDITELRVEEVFIHPGFQLTNAGLKNDIAVLKLSRK
jgi:hypothetical protein